MVSLTSPVSAPVVFVFYAHGVTSLNFVVGALSDTAGLMWFHDDVIKWKHFPRYWSFVRGIHRFPVNSPHKGQWCGALIFFLICTRINGWVNKWWDWWFETPSRPFRRHRNGDSVMIPLTSSVSAPARSVFFYAHGVASLNFVVGTLSDTAGLMWFIYAYSLGLLHWHWGNHIIAPVHVK